MKLSTSSQRAARPPADRHPRRLDPQRRPGALRRPARRRRTACELRATDMEVGLRVPLEAQVVREGMVVLPARLLLDVARSLPAGDVSLELRPERAGRRGHRRHRALPHPHAARRGLPAVARARRRHVVAVPAQAFVETIARVARSASRDETRPILTGILVSAAASELRMVATDSYRLWVKETRLETPLDDGFEANVPARALRGARPARRATTRGRSDRRAREPGRLRGRRRRALLAPDRRSVPELPPAAARDLRARAALDRRGAPRGRAAHQPDGAEERAAAAGFSEGELTVSAQTPDVGEASEPRAGAVRRRTVRDRLQPGVPARRPGERRLGATWC